MRFISTVLAANAAIAVSGFSFADAGSAIADYTRAPLVALKRSLPVLVARKGGDDGGGGGGGHGICPAIWTNVVADLSAMFLDTTVNPSQCNDDARAAIREAFHDCGTWNKAQGATGGCDGSLILANEAFDRPENNGLQDISTKLLNLRNTKYPGISVADLIQVAASVAIVTCPKGPRVTTFVGRKDSSTPAPPGLLPDVKASGDSLLALFIDKGFDARDLAALVGAHSTSKALAQPDIPFKGPQDDTPGIWDVHFYANTLNPPQGVFPFQSDINLAGQSQVGKEFKGFIDNQGKWTGKFADAMGRMALLGVPGGSSNLIDCTNVIPKGTSSKREMRAAPIGDRLG